MRLRAKPLAELEAQLAAARDEQEHAAETLRAAEQTRRALDGLDPAAWAEAERVVAAAGSEAARLDRGVAGLFQRCGDESERLARVPVDRAEGELTKLDGAISELEASLAARRAERAEVEDRLESAREALSEARVAFVAPGSPEYRQEQTRAAQEAEQVRWAAAQEGRELQLPKRLRARAVERRAQLTRAAEEAQKRADEASRAGRGPYRIVERVERVERLGG